MKKKQRVCFALFRSNSGFKRKNEQKTWGGYAANGDTQITANVRIPAGQNPPVGYYSDTIVFTVIF